MSFFQPYSALPGTAASEQAPWNLVEEADDATFMVPPLNFLLDEEEVDAASHAGVHASAAPGRAQPGMLPYGMMGMGTTPDALYLAQMQGQSRAAVPAPSQLATQLWNDEGLSNALAALDTFSSITGQPPVAPPAPVPMPAPVPAVVDSSRLGVRLEPAAPVPSPTASMPMHGGVYGSMPGMPAAGPNIMSMLQGAQLAPAAAGTAPPTSLPAGSPPDAASLMSLLSAGGPAPAGGSLPAMPPHGMPHGMPHGVPHGVPHGMPPAGTYGWMPQTAGYMPPQSAPGMPRSPVELHALQAMASRLPPQQVHMAYAQAAMAAAHQQQQQQQQFMQMEHARRLAGQPTAVSAGGMPPGMPAHAPVKLSSDVPSAAVGMQPAAQAAPPVTSAAPRPSPPLPVGVAPPLPAGAMPPLPANPPPPLPQQPGTGMVPAGAPPASLAHLFSISLNTGHRRYMSRGEIMFIASRMYKNISVAEKDIFSQAYYLFALHAKRRSAAYRAAALGLNPAPATAASSAAPADAADAADRAGNVLDMLASLSVTATAREAARGSTDGEKPAATSTSESKSGDASGKEGGASKKAAGGPRLATIAGSDASTLNLVTALPMQNVYLATKASNMQDLGRVRDARRRAWEQHNHILGRISAASSVRQKTAITLTSDGMTSLSDIDNAVAVTSLSVSPDAASGSSGVDAERDHQRRVLWACRDTTARVLDTILLLQDAARNMQTMSAIQPPLPASDIAEARDKVATLRAALASALHVTEARGGSEDAEASAFHFQSILFLPKGKRALLRAAPLLTPEQRVDLITASLRALPFVITSQVSGEDADAADVAASKALLGWIKAYLHTAEPATQLRTIVTWMKVLMKAHEPALLRTLLLDFDKSQPIAEALLLTGGSAAAAVATRQPEVHAEWESMLQSLRTTLASVA